MIHELGPRTRRIFELLRHRILSGELACGDRLPSHQQLAAQFGVAPMTMRHVLARLEHAGLVSREVGRGTFVRRPEQACVLIVTATPGLGKQLAGVVVGSGRSAVAAPLSVADVHSALGMPQVVSLALVELGQPSAADVLASLRVGWPDLPVVGLLNSSVPSEQAPACPLVLAGPPWTAQLERLLDGLVRSDGESRGGAPGGWMSRLSDPAVLVERATRRVVAWNAAAQALLGYPGGAAGDLSVDVLVPARIQAELRGRAAADEPASDPLLEARRPIELPLVQAGGQEVWVELTASDLGNDAVLLLARDRVAERATRDTLDFQALLLEAVEQAVVATDPGGTINYWNRGAERLYGWRADEVLGRNIGQVLVAPALQASGREIMDRLREGASWSGEFPVQRRDGTSVPVLVTDSPIRDPDGRLVGIIGVAVELSERKQAEADRLERARLEGLLVAATEQLARLGHSLSLESL